MEQNLFLISSRWVTIKQQGIKQGKILHDNLCIHAKFCLLLELKWNYHIFSQTFQFKWPEKTTIIFNSIHKQKQVWKAIKQLANYNNLNTLRLRIKKITCSIMTKKINTLKITVKRITANSSKQSKISKFIPTENIT